MKKSGIFGASVAAAAAFSASSSSSTSSTVLNFVGREQASTSKDEESTPPMDKFAPRFDGLRFIETLVTAHR